MNKRVRRQRQPALLHRAVRPQRGIDGVGNQPATRRQRGGVLERAGLREQRRERPACGRRAGAGQLVNAAADAAHLAEVQLVVLIEAERRQAGVIAAGVRAGTGGHEAKQNLAWRAGGFVQNPDFFLHVVAENVFAAQVGGELAAPIHIPANDRLAFTVGVINDRPLVDTDVRRRQITAHAFDAAPLKIQPRRIGRFDQVDFFARTRADVTDENPSAWRVVRHPVRAAETQRVKLLQDPGLSDKRIVVRDEIIRGRAPGRLARNRMADVSPTHVHVDAKHAGEKTLVDDLRRRPLVVTIRPVEKPIEGMEEHPAAVVPYAVACLIDQHQPKAVVAGS